MPFCIFDVLPWTLAQCHASLFQWRPLLLPPRPGARLEDPRPHARRVCTPTPSSPQPGCGLRLHEALSLQVRDVDSPRHTIHIHRGTGAKDRSVPLPHDTLELWRLSWTTHRHPTWLFPATGRAHHHLATATSPMRRSSVQGAFRTATQRAGILKRDIGVHTLRHASATPLLAAGVNRRAMQRSMGHAHLDTPMLSLHLTHKGYIG
jgi:integrase/recombinase XerD